jgi:hypothetical protein
VIRVSSEIVVASPVNWKAGKSWSTGFNENEIVGASVASPETRSGIDIDGAGFFFAGGVTGFSIVVFSGDTGAAGSATDALAGDVGATGFSTFVVAGGVEAVCISTFGCNRNVNGSLAGVCVAGFTDSGPTALATGAGAANFSSGFSVSCFSRGSSNAIFASSGGKGKGVGTGGPLEAGTLSDADAPVPFGESSKGIAVSVGLGVLLFGIKSGE